MLQSFLFYVFAAIVVLCALAMILSRNLVHSALFMAASFLGMALIYLLLRADYLAVVQILVYVGAISILFVFGIMLTKRERMEDTNRFNRYGFLAAFVGLGLFALLVRAIGASSSAALASGAAEASGQAASPGSAVSISNMLLGDMALPLEASALLLLAALAGAIVIGKGTRKNK
ncbi:MAG: NADH-quinone oxidoreductase subunit J [Rectinemataceae bacterium]